MNKFTQRLGPPHKLKRIETRTLQLNLGKRCNQTCSHCHVDAGPHRKEVMSRGTLERILEWLRRSDIPTVDITGGAPELCPDFRWLVQQVRAMAPVRHVIDRCNLTILSEPGQGGLAGFLAEQEVEIIASLPCYSSENVDEQRGAGVFDLSIEGLRMLNRLGYGIHPSLKLQLVYNPLGAFLPGPQATLEADYKEALQRKHGVVFNHLLTLANLPIARFGSWLRHQGQYDDYMNLLVSSFNPRTVEDLMCRSTLSVDWEGRIFDCDFNQMLGMQWRNGKPLHLWEIDPARIHGREIMTADHCFACTAGVGSSCAGALVAD